MSRRTFAILIVLLLVIIGIVWASSRKNKSTPTPVLSVSAFNQTKNTSVDNTQTQPQDVIVYTLTAENQGDNTISGYIMEVNISDITDKATLQDASGAAFNGGTNSLVWNPLDINPHASITKQFTVRINPFTAAGSTLKVKFNNEVDVAITAPQVAGTTTPNKPTPPPANNPYKAPTTGPSEYLPVLLAALSTAAYLIIRKYRQVKV